MKNEIEYLTEVNNQLDAIQRTADENRRFSMRRELHGSMYRQMGRYGFKTIDEVRDAVDCMKEGKPDPSKETRLKRLQWYHSALSKRIEAMQQELQQEKDPEARLPFIKGPHYGALDQMDKDKEIEPSLDLE